MRLPSEDEKKKRFQAFIDATSNERLKMVICAVCAREVMRDRAKLCNILAIEDIQRLLVPRRPHPAHSLWNGMLLEHRGLDGNSAWVCSTCFCCVGRKRTPRLCLANGLWIGEIPCPLKTLTLPEQLLIARHFPKCYVIKLYPKNFGGNSPPELLQSALRGNVTLYEQNMNAIAHMLEGNLLPQFPCVLAAVLAITFVGTAKLPLDWLRSTFRVRRKRVGEALLWLKSNNPIYQDVEVSRQRLDLLPADDIPQEIQAVIQDLANDDLPLRESEGYIPDESRDGGSEFPWKRG